MSFVGAFAAVIGTVYNDFVCSFSAPLRWVNSNESIRSGMAVLDVAIPTGYFMQQQKLDNYVLGQRVRNLKRAKYEEKRVLFYFDYVSVGSHRIRNDTGGFSNCVSLCFRVSLQLDHDDVCVNFTVERWFPVANMSRYLPIRVYDYYAPGENC